MIISSLEERVTMLEKTLTHLLAHEEKGALPKDWRSTLGMFAEDALMLEIDEAGRQIREADRRQA